MNSLLLVEDDPKISLALRIRLEHEGYTVHHAPDAVSAMGEALRHKPDAIVLDINLPGGDGFLVAERLRSNPATADCPLVFITASKLPGLADRARAVGAETLIEKPFSAVQLTDALDRAISSAHRQVA